MPDIFVSMALQKKVQIFLAGLHSKIEFGFLTNYRFEDGQRSTTALYVVRHVRWASHLLKECRFTGRLWGELATWTGNNDLCLVRQPEIQWHDPSWSCLFGMKFGRKGMRGYLSAKNRQMRECSKRLRMRDTTGLRPEQRLLQHFWVFSHATCFSVLSG